MEYSLYKSKQSISWYLQICKNSHHYCHYFLSICSHKCKSYTCEPQWSDCKNVGHWWVRSEDCQFGSSLRSLLVVLVASPLLKLNTCGPLSGTGRSQATVATHHLGSSQCFSPGYTWNCALLHWKVNRCRWKEQEEWSSFHLKKNKRCVLSLFWHSPIKFCVYMSFFCREELCWGALFWVVQWSV